MTLVLWLLTRLPKLPSPIVLLFLFPLLLTCGNKRLEELKKGIDFSITPDSAEIVDGTFFSCAAYAAAVVGDTAVTSDVTSFFAFYPRFTLNWFPGNEDTLWVSSITVKMKNANINNGQEFEIVITGANLFALLGTVNGSIPPRTAMVSTEPGSRPYFNDRGPGFSDGESFPATGIEFYSACGLTLSGIPIDKKKARAFTTFADIELSGFAINMTTPTGQRSVRLKRRIKLTYSG